MLETQNSFRIREFFSLGYVRTFVSALWSQRRKPTCAVVASCNSCIRHCTASTKCNRRVQFLFARVSTLYQRSRLPKEERALGSQTDQKHKCLPFLLHTLYFFWYYWRILTITVVAWTSICYVKFKSYQRNDENPVLHISKFSFFILNLNSTVILTTCKC